MPLEKMNIKNEKLLPVQPNGQPPLNYYKVGSPAIETADYGFNLVKTPVDVERLHKLTSILLDYMAGKANLDKRIISNEQWWKLRHWDEIRRPNEKKQEIEPTSAWLFNSVANKHADAMDNYPTPNILPREANDKREAEILSSIVPVILEQCEFERSYSDSWESKLKNGTGGYVVLWDSEKHNGLGDILVEKIDLLNLYWEPGITNIQKSKYVFFITLKDNEELEDTYPELIGKLGGKTLAVKEYIYDDTVDTTNKSVVIDCYYKTIVDGNTTLHYVKYVGDTVLYATENDDKLRERGLYDHGKYPFILDPLFKLEGTPAGLGYIDIGKNCQEYIDRLDQNIIKNSDANSRTRAVASDSAGINMEQFADLSVDIIQATGSLDENHFKFIKPPSLDGSVINVKNNKIEELKEVTGNRDVATGGTTSGVTAASAIAAMQEASSKLSRDAIKSSYRVYRELVVMIIELIRQFYDVSRCFRITGDTDVDAENDYQYVQYSNAGIVPQMQGGIEFNVDVGYRIPLFDVNVTAEKQSPYTKMAQNELALQFFKNGFFNPEMADQVLSCLKMMDSDGKNEIIRDISRNANLYKQYIARTQMTLALAQRLDAYEGTNLAEQIASEINGTPPPPLVQGNMIGQAEENPQLGGDVGKEPATTKKARERVAESTAPR